MRRDLPELARRALACVGAEQPSWYRRVVASIPAPVVVEVDLQSPFALTRCDARLAITPPLDRSRVRVTLTSAGLDALVDGHTSILDAVVRGDLDVHGAAADIEALERAFHFFLHGAARSLGFDRLADEWRHR